MIAGSVLSNNQGVAVATDFTNAISSYTSTSLLTPLFATFANSASANLHYPTIANLITIGSNTCPALSDSTPMAYANTIGNIIYPRIQNTIPNYATITAGISGTNMVVIDVAGNNAVYAGFQLAGTGVTPKTLITADIDGMGGAGNYTVSISQSGPNTAMTLNLPPEAYGNSINGFTGVIVDVGNTYLGQGNTTVFAQVFGGAQGYLNQSNDFVNTAYNSQTYLGSTFTSMNSLITGNLTDVNLALPAFGQDLARLGFLIDLADLGNFGLPSTVFRRLATVTDLTPGITLALKQVGLSTTAIQRITDPDATLTDTEERKLYQAMTLITGSTLQQICFILDITLPVAGITVSNQPQNPGLTTMADLLNPVKIFPTSFVSLTVRTYNQNTTSELRAIYIDATGNVNSKLTEYLPRYVITVVPA